MKSGAPTGGGYSRAPRRCRCRSRSRTCRSARSRAVFSDSLRSGVEIEIEHEIDVRPSAVVERLEVHDQIPQQLLVDVELGIERPPDARAPALRPAVLVNEDVGLERAEPFLAHLAADRLDAVEVGDRWLVPVGMVDAPRGAMRPVEPDAVALLAAEQLIARHAEPLGLGV